MRSLLQWRSRPAAENLLLLAVAACLAVAVVRVALVAAAVAVAPSASTQSAAWKSWWADRELPVREGGDYLGVISSIQPARAVGAVIGVVIERDKASGIAIDRVLVPTDEKALFGRPPGALFRRPDGTTFRSLWAPVATYAKYFTDVPVQQAVYAPFLDGAAFAALVARTRLTERSHDFFTAAPAPAGSGTWILLSRQGVEREYLLVPIALAPAGDRP